MKKIIAAMCCIAMFSFLFIGCSKDDGGPDKDGTDSKMTWEKLVEKYPFMENFPKYDGDIEFPQYNKTFGMESVGFFDYKCDASMATKYYTKLATMGFTVNPNAEGIYTKTANGYDLTFTGAHSAGNFGMVFACNPID
ncbi:MAG: hypothetical protein PUB21_03835 [Bacteroidales bacterium]|nr:hypothetical protein [Bacteroidales bacterium]